MTTSSFVYDELGPYILKDPNAVLDYRFDWVEWLNGDTISVSTISAVNGTIASQSNTTSTATAWISGGVAGQVITVTSHITTAAGRQEDRTVRLKVKSR
jgi:hypothetical protein